MINIAGYIEESVTDGPGIRFTLFMQGCPHRCPGCHNPQTHEYRSGKNVTAEEVFNLICDSFLISGVTFSGGEPFVQAEQLIPLAKLIKSKNLELAIYTGYTFEELIAGSNPFEIELLKLSDILIDGRFLKDERTLSLPFRGSKNQRIINIAETFKMKTVILDDSSRWNPVKY